MNEQPPAFLYREEQRFRQWWVLLLVLGIAALSWWGFYEQIVRGRPWGNNPGPDWVIWLNWLIFGIAFPWWFYSMRLVVEVTPQAVQVWLWPLARRTIPLNEIAAVQKRIYQPLREFGGWGVRGLSRRRMAYTVSGDQGVQLTLHNGDIVLIGSQEAPQFALAVEAARRG